MRLSGALILLVVIAMGIVVLLQSRDLTAKKEAIAVIATELREEDVDAADFDRDRAFEVIVVLDGMVANPHAIARHADDLKTISSTAASWAAGAASPSPELHAAVAIRKAAGELRGYAVRPSDTALVSARHELERARHALTTASESDGTTAPSGLVTEGIQDRIENLEASQKERALELEEDLGP